ncbi:MAG TPA: RNA polymerase sigma factor SigJ [Jatrophihabitantaceae bacterium]|jgi:RNA polymerase sigma-70 factor (ECF subfamily)
MVDQQQWQAEQFLLYRRRLLAVAYRTLGSVSEAEDAVQEAWLRWSRTDEESGIENVGGWLTTVVGRICIDILRRRRDRREEYVGTQLPEPLLDTAAAPDTDILLTDSVGLALLVVLETLSPAERLAFVLHDLFDVPFEEVAHVVDRNVVATRQLASRARRRVRGARPTAEPDLVQQRELVDAFLAASREGDFDQLIALLDPDVVFRIDTGTGPWQINGAADVARHLSVQGRRFAVLCRPALVDGTPGLVIRRPRGSAPGVVGFSVVDGRIAAIDLVTDPEQLHVLPLLPADEPV